MSSLANGKSMPAKQEIQSFLLGVQYFLGMGEEWGLFPWQKIASALIINPEK